MFNVERGHARQPEIERVHPCFPFNPDTWLREEPTDSPSPLQQMHDLETLQRANADVIVIGTPVDLRRLLRLNKPAVRLTYELEERSTPGLADRLRALSAAQPARGGPPSSA